MVQLRGAGRVAGSSEVNCMFDREQWTWRAAEGFIDYGMVDNSVRVAAHPKAYTAYVAVPQDLHKFLMDMYSNTEKDIFSVELDLDNHEGIYVLVAMVLWTWPDDVDTVADYIHLWTYPRVPPWLYKI